MSENVYRIKPLRWEDGKYSETVLGSYMILRKTSGGQILFATTDRLGEYSSVEDAHLAAEAHYRARMEEGLEAVSGLFSYGEPVPLEPLAYASPDAEREE